MTIANAAHGFSALIAFLVLFHQAEWRMRAELLPVVVMVLAPYLICLLLNIRMLQAERPYPEVAGAFSVVVLLFTAAAYGSLYIGKTGSTGGLAFFAVPAYILGAAIIILGIANLLLLFRMKR